MAGAPFGKSSIVTTRKKSAMDNEEVENIPPEEEDESFIAEYDDDEAEEAGEDLEDDENDEFVREDFHHDEDSVNIQEFNSPESRPSSKVSVIGLWLAFSFIFAGIALHFIGYRRLLKRQQQSACRPPPRKLSNSFDYSELISSLREYVEAVSGEALKQFRKPKDDYVNQETHPILVKNEKRPSIVFNFSTEVATFQVSSPTNEKSSNRTLKHAVAAAVASNLPMVIRSPALSASKALKWSYKDFSNNITFFNAVLFLAGETSNRVFLPSEDTEENIFIYPHLKASKAVLNFKSSDFIKGVDSPQNFYFFSGNYRVIEDLAEITNDLDWKSLMYSEPIAEGTNVSVNSTDPSLTLMYPNTALQVCSLIP